MASTNFRIRIESAAVKSHLSKTKVLKKSFHDKELLRAEEETDKVRSHFGEGFDGKQGSRAS